MNIIYMSMHLYVVYYILMYMSMYSNIFKYIQIWYTYM